MDRLIDKSTTVHETPARVLQVVGHLGMGGAETMLMNVYRAADRSLVQYDFLVFGAAKGHFDDEVRHLGGRIIRVPVPRCGGLVSALPGLYRAIKGHGPFVAVHAHVNLASAFVLLAARLARVPKRVAHSHSTTDSGGGPLRWTYRSVARASLRLCSTDLAACGHEAAAHLFGTASAKAKIVPNPVNLADFLDFSDGACQPVRKDIGVDEHSLLLVSIGRLVDVKNHAFLLELIAMARAAEMNVELMLVGEGPLRGALQQRAEILGVANYVHFLGSRSDVPHILHAADVFLLPSVHEGLPMVLVEAQAAGLMSLVSDRVTPEIDLGFGLLEFLPLDSTRAWFDRLQQVVSSVPKTVTAVELKRGFESRGFTASQVGRMLESMYLG